MEEKNSYLSADPETIRQIDEKMPPEEELQDLAEFFKVFGDATRLKILSVLLCSEMCVYDIATLLGMSQSAISHQLRVLKQMDLPTAPIPVPQAFENASLPAQRPAK